MSREQKIILILAIVLFLACIAITCLVGLLVGGAWLAVGRGRVEMPLRPFEYDFDRSPMRPEPWEWPEGTRVAALVIEVAEGGPAAEAGLRLGDMIVAIDGKQIEPEADLKEVLSGYEPGDRIALTVRRGSREREVQVRLGKHPQTPGQPYLGLTYRLVPVAAGGRRIQPD